MTFHIYFYHTGWIICIINFLLILSPCIKLDLWPGRCCDLIHCSLWIAWKYMKIWEIMSTIKKVKCLVNVLIYLLDWYPAECAPSVTDWGTKWLRHGLWKFWCPRLFSEQYAGIQPWAQSDTLVCDVSHFVIKTERGWDFNE